MHLLSAEDRSEFLAVPELVRFTMAHDGEGFAPTLLIKASTLMLKYLARLRRFDLVIFGLGNDWIGYGVQIHDDPSAPASIWSVLERPAELKALRKLTTQPNCAVFLFNELAVNVAWAEIDIGLDGSALRRLLSSAKLHPTTDTSALEQAHDRLADIESATPDDSSFLIRLPEIAKWHEVRSTYITNRLGRSMVSIFAEDEGAQQEEIALWLVDNLRPDGALKRPRVHLQRKSRELADLLMSHRYGSFLFESKALSILSREALPSRAKLTADVRKHIAKATNQLAGGLRNLRLGARITDSNNQAIEVEREAPAHAIILVPDLALLSQATEFGGSFLKEFSGRTRSFLQILDLVELLRMVQAAEMIEARCKTTTRLMAFDAHLFNRFEVAAARPTPELNFLIRFPSDT